MTSSEIRSIECNKLSSGALSLVPAGLTQDETKIAASQLDEN